jgi:hypothetical protein
MLTLEMLKRAAERANADPEFLVIARTWNSRLRLCAGDTAFEITIRDGVVQEPAAGAGDAWSHRITATTDAWSLMMQPVPPPFYHDVFAASTWHGVSIEGEEHALSAYYHALRRFFDLMREASQEVPHAAI